MMVESKFARPHWMGCCIKLLYCICCLRHLVSWPTSNIYDWSGTWGFSLLAVYDFKCCPLLFNLRQSWRQQDTPIQRRLERKGASVKRRNVTGRRDDLRGAPRGYSSIITPTRLVELPVSFSFQPRSSRRLFFFYLFSSQLVGPGQLHMGPYEASPFASPRGIITKEGPPQQPSLLLPTLLMLDTSFQPPPLHRFSRTTTNYAKASWSIGKI